MKILTAKQKSEELGISMRALAKSRHLYKHKPISPRKFLYFEEETDGIVRPIIAQGSVNSVGSGPRSNRRRNVPFGNTNYSKAPGGSGENLKLLNQMRSKVALEGKIPPEKLNDFNEALAHKVNENYEEINEQRKAQLQQELMRQDEATRKHMQSVRDPIEREPIRKYPYTMISNVYPTPTTSNWKYADKQSDERNERGSWLDSIPTKYEYY